MAGMQYVHSDTEINNIFRCLLLGGGEIANVRSAQTSATDVVIMWDAPFHPVGGYTLRIAQLGIDTMLSPEATSFTVEVRSQSVGQFTAALKSFSTHFVGVLATHSITRRGERGSHMGICVMVAYKYP